MVGHGRLRKVERLDEVADADLVGGREPVEDRHPRRIGQGLELRREHGCFLRIEDRRRRSTAENR